MWRCPLCQQPLQQSMRTWRCENRHAFDEAKSGYLNLLPVQNKKSKQPGDDKTMVNARRQFHDAKGYEPLMAALVEVIQKHYAGPSDVRLFDAGCGEGSYLGYIAQALQDAERKVNASGCDIAKHAVDLAAKRYKNCHFAVASSAHLPLEDNSQDVVLQVFAPGSNAEYQRVIAPGGLLIAVDPAENHLWSIKQAIYDNPRQHKVAFASRAGFSQLIEQRLSFTVDLSDPQTRQGLLEMTPYYWRLPQAEAQARFADIKQVEADFVIHVWQRDHR